MNVVISGPFGYGSLSDEAVLAGLLFHLKKHGHDVTVLTPEPLKIEELHGVAGVKLDSPGSLLSTPKAWEALSKAHLMVLAGAGIINATGKIPARVWLSHLEHARRAGPKTAVVGVGAEAIADPRERVRVQRLLHNFTDYISTRDDASKVALTAYGLSSSRVSHNGDPLFALAAIKTEPLPAAAPIGIVFSAQIPRNEFAPTAVAPSAELVATTRELIRRLIDSFKTEVLVFHDDLQSIREPLQSLPDDLPEDSVSLQAIDCPFEDLYTDLAQCGAVFSYSLHGLILAASAGVPVAGLAQPGAQTFMNSIFMNDFLLPAAAAIDPAVAEAKVRALLDQAPALREKMKAKMTGLARKQNQDARTMELLVPKRDRMPPREPKPKRKRAKKVEGDPWFSDAAIEDVADDL